MNSTKLEMIRIRVPGKKRGFTLLEIMIVVTTIGLLATLATPSFVRARSTSQQTLCIDNLRQIDGAKDIYGLENGNTVFTLLSEVIPTYIKRTPQCPAAGVYAVNALGTTPTCNVSGHLF